MTRSRFSPAEVALLGTGLVVLTWFLTAQFYLRQVAGIRYFAEPALAELIPLEAAYGPDRSSANAEEWNIRDFFRDQRGGVFLDVGANHYKNDSNTYFLETNLGWSGIAVDALQEFAADYATHRRQTRYVAAFASDRTEGTVRFFVPPSGSKLWASQDPAFTAKGGDSSEAVTVPTTTLNTILEQAGVSRLDLLSMDIELSEPAALKGFDIDKYQPALVCIEGHPEIRQILVDYFDERDYRLVGKYLRVDVTNLYFTPAKSR